VVADDTPAGPPVGMTVFRATVHELEHGLKGIKVVKAKTADDAVGLIMEAVNEGPVEDPAAWWDKFKITHIAAECRGEEPAK
jgi:hypothetical protein